MKRTTKFLYLPAPRATRRMLHKLDKMRRPGFLSDLSKQMMREVPRPSVISRNGKWVKYEGP